MSGLLLALSLSWIAATADVPVDAPIEVDPHLQYWTETALRHPSELLRKNAARTLGGLGNREAVPALIGALKDSLFSVRLEAAKALGKLGDERAFGPLADVVSNDTDRSVRRAAEESISLIQANVEFQKQKAEKQQSSQAKKP